MYKFTVVSPMAAIRLISGEEGEHVTLTVGDVLVTSQFHQVHDGRIIFQCYNLDYMCAEQVFIDCTKPLVESKVEVPVESVEEFEFFGSLKQSLEQAVEIKQNTNSDIYNQHVVQPASNDEQFDTFEEKLKHTVADAVARLYQINDRYVRDFQIRLFSDGSMQIRESDEVDAEIVMEFGDDQGFVVGDVHGNIQKWVDMIMDVGFIDHIINHKTSFAARYNLR